MTNATAFWTNAARKWTDEELDEALAIIEAWSGTEADVAIRQEVARRAEIRIERSEYGGQHDAAWYEPRPRCESGWTGDRCTFDLFHDGPHSN